MKAFSRLRSRRPHRHTQRRARRPQPRDHRKHGNNVRIGQFQGYFRLYLPPPRPPHKARRFCAQAGSKAMKSSIVKFAGKLPTWVKVGCLALLGAALIAFPIVYPKSYVMGVMCRIFMYMILAGSLNVINGYSGQFNIGHAEFLLHRRLHRSDPGHESGTFVLDRALPLGGVMAALIGLLVATPTLKLRGTYLAIVTLGFSEIIRLVALNWGGPHGRSHRHKGDPRAGVLRVQGIEVNPLLLHFPRSRGPLFLRNLQGNTFPRRQGLALDPRGRARGAFARCRDALLQGHQLHVRSFLGGDRGSRLRSVL